MIRLVSWNINSVRARLALIDQLIGEIEPQILCLQETKASDDVFPGGWFEKRGFGHQYLHGQKSYHGVATLSRLPLEKPGKIDWCSKGDARHISTELGAKVVLHNFYVPAGGDEPDPETNDKFAHKLAFLDEMIAWSKKLRQPSILVGDLNVAPHEEDVWSHKALLKVVSHTPPETERLARLMATHDWVDAVRHFTPRPEQLYSWWSYRARDWEASDRGRRLDHAWISPGLKAALVDCRIHKPARGWLKPSDHAPIVLDLDL